MAIANMQYDIALRQAGNNKIAQQEAKDDLQDRKDEAEARRDDKREQERKEEAEKRQRRTEKLLNQINKTIDGIYDNVEDSINSLKQNNGKILARLQGSQLLAEEGNNWFKAVSVGITGTLKTASFVRSEKVIENLVTLASQGISFNLEERSYIAALSEKMVATFDVLDSTLTRLVRLQQFDLTSTSLGSEAKLTTFLNDVFQDSSYLDNLYDSVNEALIDATSQLNVDQATSFTYGIQKWLGSLYSVGMSQSGVNTLASGINALATGDISSLSGNTALQNLFALSAKNANLNYATLLKGGLDADNIDSLMTSMVQYLQGIMNNTDNNVVMKQWADVLGISMSDLRSIYNLTASDIKAITGSNTNIESSQAEYLRQLSEVNGRTIYSEQAENVLGNILSNAGYSVFDSDKDQLLYLVGKSISELGGDMLNGVQVFGFDLGALVSLLGKGIATGNALSSMAHTIFGNDTILGDLTAKLLNPVGTITDGVTGIIKGIGTLNSKGILDNGGWSQIGNGALDVLMLSPLVDLVRGIGAGKDFVELPPILDNPSGISKLKNNLTYTDRGKSIAYVLRDNEFGKMRTSSSSTLTYDYKTGSYIPYDTTVAPMTYDQVETVNNLAQNAEIIEQAAETVVSNEVETTKTIDDLYTELFVNQTSVNVNVKSIDEQAAEVLNNIELLKSIYDMFNLGDAKVSIFESSFGGAFSTKPLGD